MVREGRFKQDLLDRLAFEVLYLPPLRERREDICLLARHFAGRMALELGRREMPAFSRSAEQALERYAWPGNVRELKNVVERAVYRSRGQRITAVLFDPFDSVDGHPPPPVTPPETAPETAPPPPGIDPQAHLPLPEAIAQLQVHRLREALQSTRFNQRQAAARLGLTYDQLRGLVRRFKDRLEP
jgi:psp operon transcriptional activator